MEEIDIIELLKRVKEGKAPKRIEINGTIFKFCGTAEMVGIYDLYLDEENQYWQNYDIDLQTKITILDKPIIEELKVEEGHTDLSGLPYTIYPTKDEIIEKINQIIRHINKEEK